MAAPKASFNGVVSLRNREEVVELIEAVARVVTVGNIFENLQRDSQSWRPLLQDLLLITKAAKTFFELCLDPEGKQKTLELSNSMETSARALAQMFLNIGNTFPSPQQQNEITTELQNILFKMAEVTDVMEEDQVFRIKRAAKLAFQHVLILRETTNDYRIDQKIEDLRFSVNSLMQCLDNRLNVLPESPLSQDLSNARYDISENLSNYIDNSKLFIAHLNRETQGIRDASLEPIVLGIKTIIELIGDTLTKGSCSFNHEQILQDLNKLTDAVKQGSTSEAAGSARLLVEELNKMKSSVEDEPDNTELSESCERLSEMTQRLLAATKDALTSKSEAANQNLAATVDDVKEHIVQVANIEKKSQKSSALRMQLLEAAKNMSSDMNNFVDILQE